MLTTKLNREHSFDTELAEIHGIEKAILLKNFDYWVRENERRQLEEFFFNGQYWTAESFNSLCKKYRYMKKPSVHRWLEEMVNDGWLNRVKRVGDVSFYRPGKVFDAWNNGQEWQVFQNGTPGEKDKEVFQNGTVSIPKWNSKCSKMEYNNIDNNIELIKEVEEEKTQAEKIEILYTSKQKKTARKDISRAAAAPAAPAETPQWAQPTAAVYNPGTPEVWKARIEQEANESTTFDMWGIAFSNLGVKLEGPQDLAKKIADFEIHRTTSGVTYHRESDYRQHFKNWISRRRQIETTPQQTARPTNYRQNQPAPTPQPRNYKGPVYGQ